MSNKFKDLLNKLPASSQKKINKRVSDSVEEIVLGEMRKIAGYTQVELASKMGVSQSALSQLEKNKNIQMSTLAKLVKAIGGELEVNVKYKGKELRISDLTHA